jgi:hypothetical protein
MGWAVAPMAVYEHGLPAYGWALSVCCGPPKRFVFLGSRTISGVQCSLSLHFSLMAANQRV